MMDKKDYNTPQIKLYLKNGRFCMDGSCPDFGVWGKAR